MFWRWTRQLTLTRGEEWARLRGFWLIWMGLDAGNEQLFAC